MESVFRKGKKMLESRRGGIHQKYTIVDFDISADKANLIRFNFKLYGSNNDASPGQAPAFLGLTTKGRHLWPALCSERVQFGRHCPVAPLTLIAKDRPVGCPVR
jgi:hypothetical protein